MNRATGLTVLVPNYNRPAALERLLNSVFDAISHAAADDRVQVVVVDDYSDVDISDVIGPYKSRSNFKFRLQTSRCGVAETAFLSALEHVDTEYVWLLGNDDKVSIESALYILRAIDATNASFILLNHYLINDNNHNEFTLISATSSSVLYERSENLFLDFGFVTSTTTFPCLVMKAAPVRAFHRQHRLTDHGTVYSHTFTLFAALRDEPGLFLAKPIVGFTLNEARDEQQKLQRHAPHGIMFYHHTLGLARLIRACAKVTGVTVEQIGSAFEDEITKDTLQVAPTRLSHFLVHFCIEQLCLEQHNVETPQHGFAHLVRSETNELDALIRDFGDKKLWCLYSDAMDVFNWQVPPPRWKIEFLRMAQDRLRLLARDSCREAMNSLPLSGPRKVAIPNYTLTPLRGTECRWETLGSPG